MIVPVLRGGAIAAVQASKPSTPHLGTRLAGDVIPTAHRVPLTSNSNEFAHRHRPGCGLLETSIETGIESAMNSATTVTNGDLRSNAQMPTEPQPDLSRRVSNVSHTI